MAKRKRRIEVEVVWVANDTTQPVDRYTARRSSIQTWDDGRAVIRLVDGSDGQGPVDVAHYKNAERIIRRPKGGKSDVQT